MTDFDRHRRHFPGMPGPYWLYRFPNGRDVSVIPDPRRPFRFEMEVDASPALTFAGLTTDEVEARLTELMALPPEDGHRYGCCGKVGRISAHKPWCVGVGTKP